LEVAVTLKLEPTERDEWVQVYASMRASFNAALSDAEQTDKLAADAADRAILLLRERLGQR
jgi:hypothetical protein